MKNIKPKISTDEVKDLIIKHIRSGIPFSLIRLNDGEGKIFSVGEPYETIDAINHHLNRSFGRIDFSEAELLYMRNNLIKAVRSADILGVPPVQDYALMQEVFLEKFHLYNDNTKFACVDIGIDLQLEDGYSDILSCADRVYCITGRNVKEAVEAKFNIECNIISVPTQKAYLGNNYYSGEHFPGRFTEIATKEIPRLARGNVFLVGAGLLGKIYCDRIKANGGVAIDIGSTFDGWAGIRTRTYMTDMEKYRL